MDDNQSSIRNLEAALLRNVCKEGLARSGRFRGYGATTSPTLPRPARQAFEEEVQTQDLYCYVTICILFMLLLCTSFRITCLFTTLFTTYHDFTPVLPYRMECSALCLRMLGPTPPAFFNARRGFCLFSTFISSLFFLD